MDEEPDFSEMSYSEIEDWIHRWLTPERKERRLAWVLMAVALSPEIALGSCPDD